MTLNKFGFLALAVLAISAGVRAESELDGVKSKAPALVLSQLNTQTQTVTKFAAQPDASISPEALKGLSEVERQARIESFVKKVAVPANKISEERVEKSSSELDKDGSTSACWWRWRGCYSGGWYGAGYYNYGYYYRPVWNYGYYNGGYGYYNGYYGGGYYGGYYNRGWNGCYNTLYTNGYYW